MIGQSETGSSSQIIFITLFSYLEGGRYGNSKKAMKGVGLGLRFRVEYSQSSGPNTGNIGLGPRANPIRLPCGHGPGHLINFVNVMMSDTLHGFVLGPWYSRANVNKNWE
jgi:hypothetical protein